MPTPQFRTLFEFSVYTETMVDQITSREDNGVTITETMKIKKSIPTYFAFKELSRAEREDADVERASWWNKFVERGLMPQAELMKKYGNVGSSMSDEQKGAYRLKRVELLKLEQELKRILVNDGENEAAIDSVALRLEELRDDITAFEREQSSYFENTAEAKAREKLIEYLVLHLSFFKTDVDKLWEPFFKGANTAEKLASFDRMVEAEDQLLAKARLQLEFLAAVRSANSGPISRENLEKYISEL